MSDKERVCICEITYLKRGYENVLAGCTEKTGEMVIDKFSLSGVTSHINGMSSTVCCLCENIQAELHAK